MKTTYYFAPGAITAYRLRKRCSRWWVVAIGALLLLALSTGVAR